MPKKSAGKTASPLHSVLLLRLRRAFEEKAKEFERGKLTIRQGMELAGSSQQLYNQIQNGASPKLITIEVMAEKLGTSVHQLLGGEGAMFSSIQSATIDAYLRGLPDDALDHIAETVKGMSIAYRSGAVPAKKSGKT